MCRYQTKINTWQTFAVCHGEYCICRYDFVLYPLRNQFWIRIVSNPHLHSITPNASMSRYTNSTMSIIASETRTLSKCWDSATCEPLDAMEVQNSTFSIANWSSSEGVRISGHYDPGRLQHAGSQDTDLSCHVLISTFCCTVLSVTTVWNSLPDFIRDPSISSDSFRRLLKTYLFARY